jgi:O-antigen/teichoic acid export membrane protein
MLGRLDDPRAIHEPDLGRLMNGPDRQAVRNAALLVAQRGLDLLRGLAFAALVPRLLGPADFGRFALVASVAVWFSLLSGMGSVQMMSRFLPAMALRDERVQQQRLLGGLLALRMLTGTGAALAYLLLMSFWLADIGLGLIGPVAAAVAVRSVANVPFAFFLGLNRAARWGAGEMARRWLSLLLVVPGVLAFGLSGAALGVLAAELCVLALGLRWASPYLEPSRVRLDREFLAPFLRYNLVFLAGNLLFAASQRSGEALLRLSVPDYAQVGHLGVALSVYLTGSLGAWQVLTSFVPLLSRLREEGRLQAVAGWAGQLLKFVGVLGVVGLAAALLVGRECVALVFGPSFAPASRLLPIVAVALLAVSLGQVGRAMALALDRARLALGAALAQTLVLFGAGLPLAGRFGAPGVATALAAAATALALLLLLGLRRSGALRLGPLAGVLTVGAALVGAACWATLLLPRPLALVVFLAGYAVALGASGLVTLAELRGLLDAVRGVGPRAASELQ